MKEGLESRISEVSELMKRGLHASRKAAEYKQKLDYDQAYPKTCRTVRKELRKPVKLLAKALKTHSIGLESNLKQIYYELESAETLEDYKDTLNDLERLLEDVEVRLEDIEGPIRMDISGVGLSNLRREMRESIRDDVDELNRCASSQCWKAVCMLAGRIIESTFIEMIKLYIADGGKEREPQKIVRAIENHNTKQLGYERLKDAMSDAGLLDTSGLGDNYFDLILVARHPSVHFRDRDTEIGIDEDVARVVIPSTKVLLKNVLSVAEKRKLLRFS